MRNRLLLTALLTALFIPVLPSRAQIYEELHSSDNQLHSVTQVSGKLTDRLGFVWGEEFYFGNNISEFQKLYSRLSLNYTLRPRVTLSTMVMYVDNLVKNTGTMVYEVMAGYALPVDDLRISLRTGLRTYDPLYETNQNPLNIKIGTEYQWRTQLGLTYRLSSLIEPYANIEAFLLLNPVNGSSSELNVDGAELSDHSVGLYLPRVRSNVGVKLNINSHHALSLYWRYDHTKSKHLAYHLGINNYGIDNYSIVTSSSVCNFVGIGYDYKF